MKSVFLDAGHNYNGSDTGASGYGLKEQDITWYIADKVKNILLEHDIQVGMSRLELTSSIGNTSVNDSLKARVKLANQMNTDIFVSIHCNAGGGDGAETYCYSTVGKSFNLANNVQTELLAETKLNNRGVRNADYYVLRMSNMPAILVKTAFIDTQSNADILGSDDGQERIAKGIAKGILKYFNINYESEDIDMATAQELEARIAALEGVMVYDYIDNNMPEWARPTVQKLMDKGILKGDEDGKLGLTDDTLKILVINDRAGLY